MVECLASNQETRVQFLSNALLGEFMPTFITCVKYIAFIVGVLCAGTAGLMAFDHIITGSGISLLLYVANGIFSVWNFYNSFNLKD